MTKIGVVGASGYAGGELLRLIHEHPRLELAAAAAGTNAGATVATVHPQFTGVAGLGDQVLCDTDIDLLVGCDLIFFALPHGESAKLIAQLPAETKIVDLGADYRLNSVADWQRYYGGPYAGVWPYGLPELNRAQLQNTHRIANPGCYATAIALGFAPILHLVDARALVAVAASGTSGAGRTAKVNLLASEVMGSMSAYKVGGIHQHTPEIEQTLATVESGPKLSFTPLLAPMPRGILATLTAPTKAKATELRTAIATAYRNEPFVQLLDDGQWPTTAATVGSNQVHIQATVDEHAHRAVVIVALDNLVKGAAGQAVQNANIILGLPETMGLQGIGVAP